MRDNVRLCLGEISDKALCEESLSREEILFAEGKKVLFAVYLEKGALKYEMRVT